MRALSPASVIPTHRSDDLLRVKIKTYQTVHKMNQLSNKIALITGATSGIGRATALAFAAEGAKVVVAGRRESEGNQVVAEIIANGGEAIFVQTDVSIEAQAENAVNQTVEKFGRLDILFNNAGIEGTFGSPLHEAGVDAYDDVFNINVRGLLFVQKYAVRAMLQTGGGSVVNTTSVAGLVGFPGAGVYDASKHAVEGITKSAALELAKLGVRVNAVAPGAVQTEMVDRAFGEQKDYVAGMHPIGRLGRPEEVAAAVVFLASDAASFITGVSLPVDGGFRAA